MLIEALCAPAMFINVSKNDAWDFPTVRQRTYPKTVHENMEGVIKPFVKTSDEVSFTWSRERIPSASRH